MSEIKVIEKIVSEDNNLVISKKAVKWIIGLIVGTIMGLFSIVSYFYTDVTNDIEKNHIEVMKAIEKLEESKVEKNTAKIIEHDKSISIVLDRTNSRRNTNDNNSRPTFIITPGANMNGDTIRINN
jgi:hypothetical protein